MLAVGQGVPEPEVERWLGVDAPPSLAALRGRVLVIEAFQMLCPGCVLHGLPLAQRVAQAFAGEALTVLGLHCVFEHHAAQGRAEALAAFLHEWRIHFPVAIDRPHDDGGDPAAAGVPRTMRRWGLRGTPSLLLIDRRGVLRAHHFGSVDELRLGREIGALLDAPAAPVGGR
jgi:hypothetical protein